jgi:mono/diheme cytochrome c family protein
LSVVCAIACLAMAGGPGGQNASRAESPTVPRTWDEEALRSTELPLARPDVSPAYVSSDYYYRMPVRPIYKSYPVYRPDREPPDYFNRLAQQEPQIVFDERTLKTEQDWIDAGRIVFAAPIEFESSGQLFAGVRDLRWYEQNHVPVTGDGVLPFMQYVVRQKGKVELGVLSCAHCHTRVMPDGTTITGAQGNFPDDRAFSYEIRTDAAQARDASEQLADVRRFVRRNYASPWLASDPNAAPERMTLDEIANVFEAIVPGVCARQGSSPFFPPRIPDLIGVKDRRYFDASGLVRHRSIGDLMRYAALNQGADALSQYGAFRPKGDLPDPQAESRYSDAQLYALSLFIYSLTPPRNPNAFDATAARGKEVFDRAGCATCHTPPLYTNNKLTPALGFTVPAAHLETDDVMRVSVGTDPRLTLQTRRGTGYYKVPSLKGVWYRGPFGHNGSVATLEDWFDARRLNDDYVATGFRGAVVTPRPVKGHAFGLNLPPEDRAALIAFLKTI